MDGSLRSRARRNDRAGSRSACDDAAGIHTGLHARRGMDGYRRREGARSSALVRSAAALLLLIAFPAMAQSRSDSAAIERGRELFASNCGFCHGPQAMGTGQAPPLARNRLTAHDRNGEILGPIIQAGRPSQGMPAFPSLTSTQISDIVSFLHARAREIRGPRVSEESLLIGNARAGEAYFNGAGNCSK